MRSKLAVALPMTFLLLFVSTLGIVAFTYYFAVERVNTQGHTLKVSTAKQDMISLDEVLTSTSWQPGSSSRTDISDNGGKLYVQPTANNLQLNVAYGSAKEYSTYNPSSYSLVGSTSYSSGAIGDLVSNNNAYMTFQSYNSGTATNYYAPSSYTLFESTKAVSGSVTNLETDDASYLSLRSYVSATSTTSNTDAYIAYRDSLSLGLTYPKQRTWDGDTSSWSSSSELSNSGSNVRWVRVAMCPISQRALEKIVVSLSDDGYLDAYVYDGTSWTVTEDIANVGTTANSYQCFDIQYEKTSGEALLVYSLAPNSNFQVGYKTWTPSAGWSSENIYAIASGTAQTAYWISAAQKPTTDANEIAIAIIGDSTERDAYGLIWSGTSIISQQLLTATVSIATEECIAVNYEQSSGYATFISATSSNAFSWQWSGSEWDTSATTFDLTVTSTPNWFTLKANPTSDELFAVSVDGSSDLNTAYWSGSAWTIQTETDTGVDSNAQRCADFAWETTGSDGLLVWGTASGSISYRTFSAPNSWSSTQTASTGAGTHPWVQLRTNTRNISGDTQIIGAFLEATTYDIGSISWDGSSFTVIGSNAISTSTTVVTYECFEVEFQRFGDPTEFKTEAEFTGTSDTEPFIELIWSIDSQCTTTGTTATFQLYNYQTYQYPTSGDGYITGAIGTSDTVLYEDITANPTDFRDTTGNWAMKLTVVKATSQQFDWNCDLSLYSTVHVTGEECSVEFSGASDTGSWTELLWTTDLSFSTTGVTTTLQLYNYAAGEYSSAGDGFIADILSQTDQTETQSITADPTDFRDGSGNWQIKITGTKATDEVFEMQVDLIEYSTSTTAGDAQVNDGIFNSIVGQVTYELPYVENDDFGLYLKGDSQSITNQSGASMTQLGIRNGAEHAEIFLSYRPKLSYAVSGIEGDRTVNDIRIFIINLNASDSIALYGKLPLKISCQSVQTTTTTYTLSYPIDNLLITSTIGEETSTNSVPITSSTGGSIIHVELVISNIKIERATV